MTELLKMINAPDSRAHFHLHDPATIAAAAINAAGTMGNGMMSGATSRGNIRRQYRYNKRLMEEQQEINLENWNRQNAYNTPAAQASRLKAAGLNPSILTQGSGSSAAAGNAAPVSSPSPQGVSPTSPANEFAGLSRLGTDYANIINSLREAKGKGLKNKLDEEAMDDRLRFIAANADLEEAKSQHEKLSMRLDEIFEPKRRTAETANLIAQAKYGLAASLNQMEQAQSEPFKRLRDYIQANLTGAELQKAMIDLNYIDEFNKTMIAFRRSETARNYAQAYLMREQGKTEGALRAARKKLTEMQANVAEVQQAMLENDLWFKQDTYKYRVSAIIDSAIQQGLISQQYAEELRRLKFENREDRLKVHEFFKLLTMTTANIESLARSGYYATSATGNVVRSMNGLQQYNMNNVRAPFEIAKEPVDLLGNVAALHPW